MRSALLIFGLTLIAGAASVAFCAACYFWFFLDGMGPGVVPSTGVEAFHRFWTDFRVPFFYCVPVLIVGMTCLWLARRPESKATR